MTFLEMSRDTLLRPLQIVCGIVERRAAPLPILSSVMLSTAGARLQLRSTDLELELTATETLGAHAAETSLTVHARKLLDVVRAMPDATLKLDLSGARLSVRAPGSRIVLHAGDAGEFPRFKAAADPEARAGHSFTIPAGTFKRLLHSVHFAMGDNEIRYFLNGVSLIRGADLTAVANDGHRLALATAPLDAHAESHGREAAEAPAATEARQVIVPRKTVLELIRLLPDDETAVRVEYAGRHVHFSFASIGFTSKLIDGRYPDFRRAIPARFDAVFALAREPFLASLQRAAVLGSGKFSSVQCLVSPGCLRVYARNAENEESVEECAIDYAGPPVDLSFNVRYLIDVLSILRAETIELRMSESSLSAMIVAPGQPGFEYVAMALRK